MIRGQLGIVCLALCGVILLEFVWAAIDDGPSRPAPQNIAASGPAGAPQIFQLPAERAFDEISARPVFNPDRRPAPLGEGAASANGPTPAPSLMISGIGAAGDQRYFVIHRDSPPSLAPMREGNVIEGWRVVAIGADDVTLSDGTSTAHYAVGASTPTLVTGPARNPEASRPPGFRGFGGGFP